jgi:ATP-dependent DNA helicase RecG
VERDAVMEKFQKGEIGVLISTTVVEVGVDVPNATVMIVQNAERFGLAQLHQLRGRVGRGCEQSYCFLCTEDGQNSRLQVLCATQDGFVIAQKDLEQRGPGEFLGQMQHGRADVRISGMLRDSRLLDRVLEANEWLQSEMSDALPPLFERAAERYSETLEEIALN